MNAQTLSFDRVHRAYRRGQDVLQDVSFALAPGQVVGLVGENGAGKTTLVRLAMGMLDAQGGAVRVFGLDPRTEPVAVKRRVGYVAEEQILPVYMTVADVVALHRSVFPTWDDRAAKDLMDRFGLPPREVIRTLSRGRARRVALMCAVAHRPELLILDEPASGLDPAARREFLETSIELLNREGTAILFSSHHMGDVERMAERLVMLHRGRVLLDESLDDLREGYSLAQVPASGGVTRERLLAHPACRGASVHGHALHAIVRLDPERARTELERSLALRDVVCRPVALEDMFVELVGGQP